LEFLWGIPKMFWSVLVLIATLVTLFLDAGDVTSSKEVSLVKEDLSVLEKALVSGQGITTDGEYFYTSGSLTGIGTSGLAKWDKDMFMVDSDFTAMPEDYRENLNLNHLGGMSYYDGKLYIAGEDSEDANPHLMVYDSDTLEFIEAYEMPQELLEGSFPWCAVDAENGYLYCSQFRDVEEIFVFDLETIEYSHSIKLSETITRIQGGEVYNGLIYLSYDAKDGNTDYVLTVDIKTGEVKTLCERNIPAKCGNEAEGITVYPMEDGSLVHILDYDKAVGVYVRHYKINE
ncbi:MAG: hypothetical protein IKC01_04190, partial [Clostridia bacterium]|nr:hypothetical protein [Clostridia bacterium]